MKALFFISLRRHFLGFVFAWTALITWPALATTNIYVTSLLDNGPGTLRAAVLTNSALGGGNTILFSNLTGVIYLTNGYAGQLNLDRSVAIVGPGAQSLTINAKGISRLAIVSTNGFISLSGLTISGGGVSQQAHAGQLSISNCVITNCTANIGGAILANDALLLADTTIANNEAIEQGGGISCYGTSVFINSTIVQNFLDISFNPNNTNANSYGGAGIFNSGNLSIRGCTIASNSVGVVNVGINNYTGTVTLTDCLVAANGSHSNIDLEGGFISGGYNLIGATIGSSGFTNGLNHDQVGSTNAPINPLLGAFGYYGGPTPVMPLLPGSPAIDQGISAGLTTDQRGKLRPADLPWITNAPGGDGSDIGAVEYDAPAPGTYVINLPITGVTHQFFPADGFGDPASVYDSLIVSQQNLTNLDLSQFGTLMVRLYTTNGQEVIVNPPSGGSSYTFQFSYISSSDTISNNVTASLVFENFSGTTPNRLDDYFGTGGGGNAFSFDAQEYLSGSLAFSAIAYSFLQVDNPTNAPKNFTANANNSLSFTYNPTGASDPGPFVSLGPILKTQLTFPNGSPTLAWPSRANQSYQVQSTTNLASGLWQNVGSPVVGNGLTNTLPVSTNGLSKSFYRLKLLPPS